MVTCPTRASHDALSPDLRDSVRSLTKHNFLPARAIEARQSLGLGNHTKRVRPELNREPVPIVKMRRRGLDYLNPPGNTIHAIVPKVADGHTVRASRRVISTFQCPVVCSHLPERPLSGIVSISLSLRWFSYRTCPKRAREREVSRRRFRVIFPSLSAYHARRLHTPSVFQYFISAGE